jgi:hypothetical protein
VYTAAIVAGGIALVSAIEAWARLQQPEAKSTIFGVFSDGFLSVALPALAIACVMALRRLRRRDKVSHSEGEHGDQEAFSGLLDENEALPSTWLRSSARARQARLQDERRRPRSAAS